MKNRIAFEIRVPLSRSDLPGLCKRLERLLRYDDAAIVQSELSMLKSNIVALEAIARLKLIASRHDRHLALSQIPQRLRFLIHLSGPAGALLDESSSDPMLDARLPSQRPFPSTESAHLRRLRC